MKEQHFTLQKGFSDILESVYLNNFLGICPETPNFLPKVLSFHCYHIPKIVFTLLRFPDHLGMNEFLE